MKALVHRFSANPRYAKAFHWGKLISITGGTQAIVQVMGLLCGILVIRLLPVKEYAWYTIANTMLGTMSLLADGGITSGVMAQGGKVWQNKEKLGAVLSTGLFLRKKFAFWSLVVSVPILIYLLLHNKATWQSAILITASLIPAFFAALSDSLLEIVPKLHQDIIPLQKNQLIVSIGRLMMTGLSVFILPYTFMAILASGIPRAYGNIRLKKMTAFFANRHQQPDLEIQASILKTVRKILPGSIYFCVSGQITIWLISIFGNATAVAKVGALGRLSMILALFTVLFNTLAVPRFARLPNNSGVVLKRFLQIQVGLILLGLAITGCAYVFSVQALWIIGPNYSNLKTEFTLSIAGSFLGLMAGTLFTLNTSRGWAINPVISIAINLVSLITGILFIHITTIRGLFIFNIFIMGTEVVMYFTYGLFQIMNSRRFA